VGAAEVELSAVAVAVSRAPPGLSHVRAPRRPPFAGFATSIGLGHVCVEGHNVRMAYRCAEGRFERLPTLADEWVRLPVDVLVTDGPGALVARQATDTIPIVFAVFAGQP
jgi:ABC-type uncharacterized transport system substrate-binding protein